MNILILLISVFAVILSTVSGYFSYKIYKQQKTFFGKSNKDDVIKIISDSFMDTNKIASEYTKLVDQLSVLTTNSNNSFSKCHIKRFNPYEEAGGDLSFCLAMINNNNDGYMITSLHGRERTRIYTRNIVKGVADGELLYDEKETLKEILG